MPNYLPVVLPNGEVWEGELVKDSNGLETFHPMHHSTDVYNHEMLLHIDKDMHPIKELKGGATDRGE